MWASLFQENIDSDRLELYSDQARLTQGHIHMLARGAALHRRPLLCTAGHLLRLNLHECLPSQATTESQTNKRERKFPSSIISLHLLPETLAP